MINPWKTIKKRVIFENKFGYRIRNDDVITPSKSKGNYMVIESDGFVAVIAITKDHKIVMVHQWRYTVGKEFIEIPAGKIELNQTPLAAAKRELLEETGFVSKRWTKLIDYWTGNGISKIKGHIFLALDVDFVGDKQDSTEKIRTELVEIEKAKELIMNGNLCEERSIIGFLLASQHLKKKGGLEKV